MEAGGEQSLLRLYHLLSEISSWQSNNPETPKEDKSQGIHCCITVVGCLRWSPSSMLAKGSGLLALNNLPV